MQTQRTTQEERVQHTPSDWSGRRWSSMAFARRWRAAKRRNPSLRALDLAIAVRRSETTLYNWRKGDGEPSLSEAFALAAVLGCDPIDFTEPA